MKIKANHAFSWAHRGCDVEQFEEGQEIETEDQDLIEVSIREGWAEAVDELTEQRASKPAANKAKKAAPENKAEVPESNKAI